MNPIRVIVADDEDLILSTLADVIATDTDLELVGVAHDTDDAIAIAEAPDVALVDVRMPGGGGTRAAREILKRSPGTTVVAYSGNQESEAVLAMLRAGAVGYVAKDSATEDILLAIHRATEGRATIATESLRDVAELLASFHLDRESAAEHASAERIEHAIHDDVIQMVFQPIVETGSLRIIGLEALARFATMPRRPPETWFAEAKRVGLLPELELVAATRAVGHLDHLPTGLSLAVNASPETLVAERFLDLLRGAVTDRIVVEMTEQSSVEGYDALNERLRPIRDLGVRLAIDDVGAGYASLRHVVALTPDLMKIDRALITGIDVDPVRHALVDRLVSFAGEVGVGVIAEGIETEAELEALRAIGVPYAQGFYLGKPGPIPLVAGERPLAWPGRRAIRSEEPVPAMRRGRNGSLDLSIHGGRGR